MFVLGIALSLVLKLLDCLTTYTFIRAMNNINREKNPVVRWLIKRLGLAQTLILIMGLHMVIMAHFTAQLVLGEWVLFAVVNGFMLVVLVSNLWAMKKQGVPFRKLIGNHYG